MKYISIAKPGQVEILEKDMPVPEEDHAILKLLYGGICGSDMGTYKGTFLYAGYPRIPGHEFSAEILEIGKNEHGLKQGMIVTANAYFNCGKCYSCQRGFVNCCTSNQTMGVQRDGAFCQYISMPIERIYDGKGLSARTLALVEPFCIAYHAAKRAGVKPGDKVLVVGAGTIGYFAVAASKLMGGEVYVCDISQNKLEYTKRLGVKGTILNTGKEAFNIGVAAATQGKGFDVCIEAVGLPSTFLNCIDAAAFRARLAIVGIGKQSLDFFYSVIQTKELDIFGSRNAKKEDFLEIIDLISKGAIDVESIISAEYAYTDAEKAFRETAEDAANRLKVMLKFL
jgi:2-desacetyl-2-hydroxyethyl bacteriochlorophyllide A dehydrogenase